MIPAFLNIESDDMVNGFFLAPFGPFFRDSDSILRKIIQRAM
jgi:hypothetical protein